MKARHLVATARKVYQRAVRRVSWPDVPPIAIALSFVLSVGPSIQAYLFALLNSDASSIYGSSYQNSLIRFPTLQAWLLGGGHWLFLSMGATVAILSLHHTRPRALLRAASASSFLALLIVDLFVGGLQNTLTTTFLFENIIANLVGAVIIGLLSIFLLTCAGLCIQYMAVNQKFQRFVAATIIIFGGVLFSSAVFYVVEFFYKPIPVAIDVHFDYPTAGTLLAEPGARPKGSDEEPLPKFKLVPNNISGTGARWTAPANELKVQWAATSMTTIFDARIELFNDCFPNSDFPKGAAPLIITDVKQMDIWFNQGFGAFATVTEKGLTYKFEVDPGRITQYHITDDKASEMLEIEQFAMQEEGATLKYLSEGHHYFYFYTAQTDTEKHPDADPRRRLDVRTDQRAYAIEFDRFSRSRNVKLTCSAVAAERAFSTGKSTGPVGYMIGVRVRIAPREKNQPAIDNPKSEILLKGASGWLTITGIPKSALPSQQGNVAFLIFHGNAAHLTIDDKETKLRPFDNYAAVGSLRAGYEHSGQLRFTGSVWALWREQTRVNPTKWERLGSGASTWLAAFFGAVITTVGGTVFSRLRSNRTFQWLGRRRRSN